MAPQVAANKITVLNFDNGVRGISNTTFGGKQYLTGSSKSGALRVFYGKLDAGPKPLKESNLSLLAISEKLTECQMVLVTKHHLNLAYYYVYTPLPEIEQKKIEEGLRNLSKK